MAYLAGAAALGVSLYFGGWYWALIAGVVLVVQWRVAWSVRAVAETISTSLLWLAMFAWTEDRRMFFPFTMHLAVMAGRLLEGRVRRAMAWGPSAVVAVFTAVRVAQAATLEVLAVELAVAVVAVLAAMWAVRWGQMAAAMVASLVALLGLAL